METLYSPQSRAERLVAVGRMVLASIADRLAISEGTVKIHFHNIYEKLAIDSRVGLAMWARDQGLA